MGWESFLEYGSNTTYTKENADTFDHIELFFSTTPETKKKSSYKLGEDIWKTQKQQKDSI